MEYLLGLDIGTSSSKGVLTTPEGTVVATAQRPHTTSFPRPGWAEHDPETVWWADAVEICRELTAQAGGRVAAMGVSGIGPCLLPVDARDRPLRPAILYGIDTRAQAEIAELTEELGAEAILRRAGSALTSQAVGPKLLWLRHHEPEVWRQARRFYMASSFVVRRLTGAYVLDHHSASQCDPMYDLERQAWASDWAEPLAPDLELPELAWSSQVVGTVGESASRETGVPAGTPVVAGTIDAWAEAHSVAVTRPGDMMIMYGTTTFLILNVDALRPDPTLWGTTGLTADSRCLAAGMATSGALTQWLSDLTGRSFEDLLAVAQAVPAGSEGMVMLPYFAGERTPIHDPDARGLVLGLTLRHGAGHLYRAALEATGYAVRHMLEAFVAAGGTPRRLVAVGGGTASALWPQIVTDITGVPQELPRQRVGACLGDAHLAGIGVGLADDPGRWNPVAATLEPVGGPVRRRYDSLYDIYRSLYPATRAQAHALAGFQHIDAR